MPRRNAEESMRKRELKEHFAYPAVVVTTGKLRLPESSGPLGLLFPKVTGAAQYFRNLTVRGGDTK